MLAKILLHATRFVLNMTKFNSNASSRLLNVLITELINKMPDYFLFSVLELNSVVKTVTVLMPDFENY